MRRTDTLKSIDYTHATLACKRCGLLRRHASPRECARHLVEVLTLLAIRSVARKPDAVIAAIRDCIAHLEDGRVR